MAFKHLQVSRVTFDTFEFEFEYKLFFFLIFGVSKID
uniref:Uncharacterized protein n=1 Tax=Rhizophora mucronata TaxID=61149 RepID=A0A2P2QMS0_RHIMU